MYNGWESHTRVIQEKVVARQLLFFIHLRIEFVDSRSEGIGVSSESDI